MSLQENLGKQLTLDEGVEPQVYKDSLGLWTIGIGRLVDPSVPGCGLRPDEIQYLFNNDLEDRLESLFKKLPWMAELDEARQGVLLNMSFQLGVTGLLKFVNTLELIKQKRFTEAATAMLQSKWAKQTPKRAGRLAKQMLTGEWVYGS
jgi:lysozyme